jgi:hypothetical protein
MHVSILNTEKRGQGRQKIDKDEKDATRTKDHGGSPGTTLSKGEDIQNPESGTTDKM